MGRSVVRSVVLVEAVAALGLVGWYAWAGVTAPPDAFVSPWLRNMWAPIGALVMLGTTLPMLGVASALGGLGGGLGRREAAGAPVGIGTVTGVARTGLSVNDQPQLAISMDVETPEGHRFSAVAKNVVDITQVAELVPGTVLPVRYLHDRPGVVFLDRGEDPALVQAAYNAVMVRAGLTTERNLDIAARGVRAQGVVSSVRPTGRLLNGNPEMEIGLGVTRPDGSLFHAAVVKVLPASSVVSVQVGRVLTVHYLPEREEELVLQTPANPGVR
ncbi:hypothetical protein [Nocardiopsis tropica]|uniref:Uncharacterized protein n=1 Tax=Nocardiopsis tropica TaxID=109330 RepID=A0ABU7KPH6_9ACTN|nr:hypothetical protein [Nocardiopsis umidischolae]MEE2051198.1 hypothetical protein [Nocardiopsis umidischolae]